MNSLKNDTRMTPTAQSIKADFEEEWIKLQHKLKREEEKDIESINILIDAWFAETDNDRAELSLGLVRAVIRNAFYSGRRSEIARRLTTDQWVDQKRNMLSG